MDHNERPRVGKRDPAQPEVPVQHQATHFIGGKPAQAVPADLLDARIAQQPPRPVRIMLRPPQDLILQWLAAGGDH